MPVLKGFGPVPPRRVEALALEARADARRVVEEARSAAAAARAAAQAEVEAIRSAAERLGREAGRAEAAALLVRAAADRDRLLAGLSQEVAGVAVSVARRILGDALAVEPERVIDLAARALEAVRDRAAVAIRISPADAARIRCAEPRLAALLGRAPGLVLREDAALAPGAVVVETEAGRVDASVDAQLGALAHALGEGAL
jgi:flagellar biosynthesis/type III secretory pathway protein FliH